MALFILKRRTSVAPAGQPRAAAHVGARARRQRSQQPRRPAAPRCAAQPGAPQQRSAPERQAAPARTPAASSSAAPGRRAVSKRALAGACGPLSRCGRACGLQSLPASATHVSERDLYNKITHIHTWPFAYSVRPALHAHSQTSSACASMDSGVVSHMGRFPQQLHARMLRGP